MEIKDIRRYRLKKLVLTRFHGRQVEFAEAIGRSASYVARLFSDNNEHSRNVGEALAREIERICEVPTGFLDEPLTNTELAGFFDPLTNPPKRPSQKNEDLPVRLASKIAAFNDHTLIPVLDVQASMGPGAQPPDVEIVASSISLETAWLRRNLVVTGLENLRVITGMGESMSPTIRHGDLLLVDTGTDAITYDAIYVLNFSGQIVLKRVQRELDGVRIISDNSKYREIMVPGDMEERLAVLGRVVYIWNGSPA